MPEICGDAGIKIDPKDTHDIASAINKIDNDQSLREKLIKLGLERSKMFNWQVASNQLTEILKI